MARRGARGSGGKARGTSSGAKGSGAQWSRSGRREEQRRSDTVKGWKREG